MADPSKGPRVLGALPLIAMIAAGAWAFQWQVAWSYQPPERLREKAAAVAARTGKSTHDIAIVGTCMSEQQIHAEIVASTLGKPWHIHNLGGRASGPIDWYMMVKNKLPEDSIEGLVVAWIRGDLTMNPSIWEGQTMDLAAWDDLPDLARWSCTDPGCGIEMALRKGSFAYRYRGFLANMFWQSVGAKAVPKAATLRPEEGRPAEAADPLQGVQPPADPNARVTAGPSPDDARKAKVAMAYLADLLDLARERGIPVWFARMPERSDAPDAGPHPAQLAQQAVIDQLIADHGATSIELPVLPMGAFLDDRHVNGYGVNVISKALGEGLKAALPTPTEEEIAADEEVDPVTVDLPRAAGPAAGAAGLGVAPGAPGPTAPATTASVPAPPDPDLEGTPAGPPLPADGVLPPGPPSPNTGPPAVTPSPVAPAAATPAVVPPVGPPAGPAVPPPPVPRGYVAPPPPSSGGPAGPPLQTPAR